MKVVSWRVTFEQAGEKNFSFPSRSPKIDLLSLLFIITIQLAELIGFIAKFDGSQNGSKRQNLRLPPLFSIHSFALSNAHSTNLYRNRPFCEVFILSRT